jgi:hypothetical protein
MNELSLGLILLNLHKSVMSSNPLAADEVRDPPQAQQVIATSQTAEIDSNEDLVSLIIPIRIYRVILVCGTGAAYWRITAWLKPG